MIKKLVKQKYLSQFKFCSNNKKQNINQDYDDDENNPDQKNIIRILGVGVAISWVFILGIYFSQQKWAAQRVKQFNQERILNNQKPISVTYEKKTTDIPEEFRSEYIEKQRRKYKSILDEKNQEKNQDSD